jgi:hypothetical protein
VPLELLVQVYGDYNINSDKSRTVASETKFGAAQNIEITCTLLCNVFYCVNKGARIIHTK